MKLNLPDTWKSMSIGESVDTIPTTGKKLAQKSYQLEGTYPVVDQGKDLIGGYSNSSDLLLNCELPVIVFGDHTKVKKYVNFKFIVGADGVKVLKPKSFFEPKLFFYFLHSIQIPDKGYARHYQHVVKQTIHVPPLPEQQRIVAKIEELFSDLDKAVESLKKAQAQLKTYRQAVLKYAFEGRLTRSWRSEQKDLPKNKEIRKSIEIERQNFLNKTRKSKPITPFTDSELAGLPTLPETWCWAKLGEILKSAKDGPHYSPKYVEKGVPFITGGQVRPDGVDFSNAKHISKDLHSELSRRCKPELGDILYTKGGTTGIARVNTYDFDFNVWVHVAVLKLFSCVNPFYVQHALNSNHCYRQSQKLTHGVGNQDLGLTRMISISVPICSIEEQRIIVAEIDKHLSIVSNLEEVITLSLEKADATRQSILKKAFEGRLV